MITSPSASGTSGSSIRQKRAWSYTIEGKRESAETLTTSAPDLTLSLREIFEALSEDLQ